MLLSLCQLGNFLPHIAKNFSKGDDPVIVVIRASLETFHEGIREDSVPLTSGAAAHGSQVKAHGRPAQNNCDACHG